MSEKTKAKGSSLVLLGGVGLLVLALGASAGAVVAAIEPSFVTPSESSGSATPTPQEATPGLYGATTSTSGVSASKKGYGEDGLGRQIATFNYAVTPLDASQAIDISCAWQDGSAWTAADHPINGFLLFESDADRGTVTVTCLQAFESKAVLKLSCASDHSKYAELTLHYGKAFLGFKDSPYSGDAVCNLGAATFAYDDFFYSRTGVTQTTAGPFVNGFSVYTDDITYTFSRTISNSATLFRIAGWTARGDFVDLANNYADIAAIRVGLSPYLKAGSTLDKATLVSLMSAKVNALSASSKAAVEACAFVGPYVPFTDSWTCDNLSSGKIYSFAMGVTATPSELGMVS